MASLEERIEALEARQVKSATLSRNDMLERLRGSLLTAFGLSPDCPLYDVECAISRCVCELGKAHLKDSSNQTIDGLMQGLPRGGMERYGPQPEYLKGNENGSQG